MTDRSVPYHTGRDGAPSILPARVETPIRVLLADDHTVAREGTRHILEKRSDFQIVGEASDGATALQLTRDLRPHILLLDIAMPVMSGVEVARIVRATMPEIKIAVLTGYDMEYYARGLARLGVHTILSKMASSQELVDALITVHATQRTGTLPADPTDTTAIVLTPRELEVLKRVAEGQQNQEIARGLSMTERTVRFHLENLFAKVQETSRTDLVFRARRAGWLA